MTSTVLLCTDVGYVIAYIVIVVVVECDPPSLPSRVGDKQNGMSYVSPFSDTAHALTTVP